MRPPPVIQEDLAAIAETIGSAAQELAGKTVLISGGAGFLGRYFLGVFAHLNRRTLGQPCRVISADNYITGDRDGAFGVNDDPNVLSLWADVTLPLPVREPVDYIIHAAGLASPVYYQRYPLETIESAVLGAKNLLELGRRNALKSFLLFSSSEIYGDPDPRSVPTPETYCGNVSSVGPRACYDESKRLAETLSIVYHQQFGVPVKIVRPFNVYGPGMRPDDRRVMPTFGLRTLRGESLPVHGDGHQTRTFCYITDALTGFLKALLAGRPGEAYNVGNDDQEITMGELASLFAEIGGTGARVETMSYPDTYPAGEPQRRCPDLKKIRTQLGYEPKVRLREGVLRFLQWASQEPAYMGKTIAERAPADAAPARTQAA
ncbi:MAG: dTDP-D-glucose 4,6-dehydratase-like protein [Parcubacteria group bacterium Gr01-1014_38]|nr:MAG: dTDP-D-glucose 4,6-dehydratase-like protein [Parcubacteria group bacterium Gr01-1014_38]